MATRVQDVLGRRLGELRYQPIPARVRAGLGGQPVVDSERAVLVWEPRRVVPTYAVPVADVLGDVVPVSEALPLPTGAPVGFAIPDVTDLPVLDPRVPFAVHTAPGDPVEIRVPGGRRPVGGLRLHDPDLAGYVVLDFAGPDSWTEEEDPVLSHPRDPFHRVDVRSSNRHVQVLLDGQLLADTHRPHLVLETLLPARWYVPVEDVVVDLEPSATHTVCAYKGQASYWSVPLPDRVATDLAWGYPDPLPGATWLRGLVAFYAEHSDLVVDGQPQQRPVTPWS